MGAVVDGDGTRLIGVTVVVAVALIPAAVVIVVSVSAAVRRRRLWTRDGRGDGWQGRDHRHGGSVGRSGQELRLGLDGFASVCGCRAVPLCSLDGIIPYLLEAPGVVGVSAGQSGA